MQRFCYFAADTEGSHGKPVIPGVSNMIALGLVLVGRPEEHFYAELKPFMPHWEARTEGYHKMTPAYLATHGVDARTALIRCALWACRAADGAARIFVAMPLLYDWELFKLTCSYTGVPNPFLGALDGRALFREAHGLAPLAKVRRRRFAREYPTSIPHLHHALGDALEFEEQVRPLLRRLGRI